MFARLFCARAFAGLVSVTMMAAILAMIPSSAHADDPPPPAPPVQYDPSCTDMDEYWFAQFSPDYDYYADGKWMDAGKKYSTNGASSVVIEARDMFRNVAETWELVFETTECDFAEAPNGYSVKVGTCHYRSGRTDLVASVLNRDDVTDRYLPSAAVNTTRSDGWGPSYAYDIVERILDGEARPITIGALDDRGGVPPGTYTLKFYLNGKYGTVVAVRKIFVPKCGTSVPPQGDPGLDGSGSNTTKKPKGILQQVKGSTMRAKAINRGVSTATRFKVVAKAPFGRVLKRWWFTVRPGKVATKFYSGKPKTRFIMSAKYKHNGILKWRVVASGKIRSITS